MMANPQVRYGLFSGRIARAAQAIDALNASLGPALQAERALIGLPLAPSANNPLGPFSGVTEAASPDGVEAVAMAERIGPADATLIGALASHVEFDTMSVRRKVTAHRLKLLAEEMKHREQLAKQVAGSGYFELSPTEKAIVTGLRQTEAGSDAGNAGIRHSTLSRLALQVIDRLQEQLEDALALGTQAAADRDRQRALREQARAEIERLSQEIEREQAQDAQAEEGDTEILVMYVRSDSDIPGAITPEMLSELLVTIREANMDVTEGDENGF